MKSSSHSVSPASIETRGRAIVERLGGSWTADGGMCRCPAHDDRTPSLSVRPGERQLLFHCFAGCPIDRILMALGALQLPGRATAPGDAGTVRGRAAGGRNGAAAASLWAAAIPLAGSRAREYLCRRGLSLPVADLRYHSRCPRGQGAQAGFGPAMLAAVRDNSGLVAVHRTFLAAGQPLLAALPRPKLALGALGEGAVRLSPPRGGILAWAEGIETAIAATMLTGIPCWSTLGSNRFARVALPPLVKRLILFLDNDPGGRRAEQLARAVQRGRGIEIEARYPASAGDDWNDMLLSRLAMPGRGEGAAG